MKRFLLRFLGGWLLLIVVAMVIFFWINTGSGVDPAKELATLPGDVQPKYGLDNHWWQSTTIYQIYPRSFKDTDGDGIGDIAGVISEIDYLQTVGFETLWLTPFFSSPQQDHGYDVSNYTDIAPEYGNLALVDSLISEIHRREMRVVFDLVLNHTSIEHPWFLESRSSRDNPKSDWYVWHDGKDGGPPNNWKNIMGQLPGWHYVAERDQWYYAAFLPFQPDLNMRNPEVRQAMLDVVRFWLDRGVDGFRLDIFGSIFEDPSYADNPFTLRYLPDLPTGRWAFENHRYNFNHPDNFTFAKELRAMLESYDSSNRFMVGEVFGSHNAMRKLLGEKTYDGLHLVFLFDIIEQFEFSADYFKKKLELYEAFYPKPYNPTYVFSNTEQIRSITRLGNDPEKAKLLATFQFTVRGVPCTFQGEEIGMRTANISLEEAQDPVAKSFLWMPKFLRSNLGILMNRDNCRTPMQWSSEPNAGFAPPGAITWLAVEENYPFINVQGQLADSNSLLSTFRRLLALRKVNKVLQIGELTIVETGDKNVLGYQRNFGKDALTIFLNFSDKTITLEATADLGKMIFSTRGTENNAVDTLTLAAYEGVVLK